MRDNLLPHFRAGKHRRPSAIRDAAKALILAELPFYLPAGRYERQLWAARGISIAMLNAVVDELAAADLIAVAPSACGAIRVTVATTTTAAGATPPADDGESNQ